MSAFSIKKKTRIGMIIPLLILFFISLNGISIINFKFITVNIHYILVYYFVLRKPDTLGYGFIFLSGIINDVVLGLPLGINSLVLLIVASVATYVRTLTVRVTLINDWISFIPALLIANFFYFISLYFSDFPINYMQLFNNSIFTIVFYPILWALFSLISNYLEI